MFKNKELSRSKQLKYYALLGLFVYIFSVVGATYSYLAASGQDANTITGNMATVDINLSVVKVTNVDNDVGLIPMSNNMVEQALTSTNGICIDDNGNAVCQVYKITINNGGSNSTFVDGYVNLTGGSGSPADYTDYIYNTDKTTMRWSQAFCGEEANGLVTSCTTAGASTARTDEELTFTGLGGEDTINDYLNLNEIKTTRYSAVSTRTINSNNYEVINKNYIRISDHEPSSNVYSHSGDITSALVYNQYLSANDKNTDNDTGTSSSTFTDSQVYYIVLWLSENGMNQTAGAEGAATVTEDFFGGKVTFVSAAGSNTAKFGNYASGVDGGANSATNYVKKLYNDGSDLTIAHLGGKELNPSVSLNPNAGIMLDNNGVYRYYGADPDNYVKYNDELWRIISVSNVKSGASDANGSLRIKLIRNTSIGELSWDSSASDINTGYGVNDWTQADLMTELNNLYYNSLEGTCYKGSNNATTSCNFLTTGLSKEARDKIDASLWYLGGGSNELPNVSYTSERSTTVYNCSTDDGACPRATIWTGIVGLMYPSDYGYATDLSLCTSSMSSYKSEECLDNNWMYDSTAWQWTLTPHSSSAANVFNINTTGNVSAYTTENARAVRPVVYLRSDIQIIGGEGTKDIPYILG
ncbi:MAG: hypothetical protein IJ509_03935 [Bacilli bacterium]|nr:hypothetical protein [Bacilli bacterium]